MRQFIQPEAAQCAESWRQAVYITMEKQSHIIMQMIHYKNESLVLL